MLVRNFLFLFLIATYIPISSVLAQGNPSWPKLERSYLNHFYKEDDSYSKKCFEELFFDQQGRLHLIPCGVDILLNAIGAFRFDGYTFQPVEVRSEDGEVLKLPWIVAIDQTGQILGTDGQKNLFLVDPNKQISRPVSLADTSLNNLEVLGLATTLEKTLVLGSTPDDKVRLFKLEGEELVEEKFFNFPDIGVRSIDYAISASSESIWISTYSLPFFRFDQQQKGLRVYEAQDFSEQPLIPKETNQLGKRFIPKFVHHPKGDTYLFASVFYENSLFQYDSVLDQFVGLKNKFPSDWLPTGIFQDEVGNVCFLFKDSEDAYQAVLETVKGEWFDFSSIVAGPESIKMLIGEDFRQQVFMITDGGLYAASVREKGAIQSTFKGLWVSAVVDLPDDRLLVNTVRNGWFTYDKITGAINPFQGPSCGINRPAFGKGMKQQVIPDNQGNLWFISQNHLVRYNPSTNECETLDCEKLGSLFALLKGSVVAFQDERHHLSFWDLNTQQKIVIQPGVQDTFEGFIRDLLVDQQDLLWVITNNGLWRIDFDQGESELLGPEQGFSDFRFTTILEDSSGRLWLGTYYGGLQVYDPTTGLLTIIDQGKGLSNNTVMSIVEDEDGDMWVGTEYGINLVSKEGEVLQSIHEEDGLNTEIFERFDPYKGRNGLLYFGTREGLNIIDTKILKNSLERDLDVQIYLTELRYFNKKMGTEVTQKKGLKELGRLEISPENPSINLKFGLSTYLETQNNRYAYLLEGKDEDWHYLGAQPELNISRLPPGKYRLLIKGADFRNNWTSEPIAIDIYARAFFYKQAWFYGLVALPFLTFGLIWARNKQQEAKRLEREVVKRTQKIREDKMLIEHQAEELRQLDTMKSHFFTNISHELRTPITLIKGPLENLIEKSGKTIGAASRNSLKLILNNASKLNKLVEELLELSRLEAKKAVLKETATPLDRFFSLLFGAYESGAIIKKINYQYKSDLKPVDHFMVDRKRLEKIVNNLLSNAIKFTPIGGWVQMYVYQEGDQIWVEVEDNGRGVPSEDLPFLFNRYFQTRRKEIATEGGTGIGLALAKELSELMHGNLNVVSEWGQGARFTLNFPAKPTEVKEETLADLSTVSDHTSIKEVVQESAIITQGAVSKPKILIVEDNVEMQTFLYSLLEDSYQCIIAGNGAEAWTWLTNNDQRIKGIELILSDVMMPEMDGYSLLEHLKEHKEWQNLPVVMLTARSAEEDKLLALRMGVDDYLLKPFSPTELKARLKNLIGNYQVRKQLALESNTTERVNLEFDQALTSANQTWLKEVENAARMALQIQVKLSTMLLAEKVFLSERQFARKLKKITGLTPNEYIQEAKLQKARQFLEHQVYSTVGEVAHACGYSSGSYLSKIYVERFGKKPSDYLE